MAAVQRALPLERRNSNKTWTQQLSRRRTDGKSAAGKARQGNCQPERLEALKHAFAVAAVAVAAAVLVAAAHDASAARGLAKCWLVECPSSYWELRTAFVALVSLAFAPVAALGAPVSAAAAAAAALAPAAAGCGNAALPRQLRHSRWLPAQRPTALLRAAAAPPLLTPAKMTARRT